LGKKRLRPSGFTIITLFWAITPDKKSDEAQQFFCEDLVFYICMGYRPFSTYKNV